MANPAVEKLKNFGLRHGEKAGVALVAALCLVSVVLAWSRETIELTPEQIKKSAEAADSNLRQPQTDEAITQRLDEAGLIPPDLVTKVVQAQQEQKADTKLAFVGPPFTFPEPGAGLIRETPTLIAPVDIIATAGRGALSVFKTDEQGNLVFAKAEDEKAQTKSAASRRARELAMMGAPGMSEYAMSGGAMPGGMTEEERKAQAAKQQERLKKSLAGTPKGTVVEQLEANVDDGMLPEMTKAGYRWVALVGKIDHQTLRDNYTSALKMADAQPHYLRLDVQRREQVDPSTDEWGDWTDVARDENQNILAYVTHKDEELAPQDVLLEGLVDMLPFLQVGDYRGVHYGPLVPAEAITPATPPPGMMAGMPGDFMGGDPGMMMQQQMMEQQMMEQQMMSAEFGYPGMGGMYGGMGQGDFPKSNAPELMIRSLDFTVVPDTAYQYRTRIVVANPNVGREDVKPGTDVKSEELSGPWSEPSDPVRVPADVTTYAMGPSPSNPNAVQFQVARFDESTGLTVVARFDEQPGEIVGEPYSAPVPRDDGNGRTSRRIDFNSRQLVLDTSTVQRPLDIIGRAGTRFNAPAMALVLRPDGMLVVRDQARDTHDPEMAQMREIYDQILKDADEGGKQPPPQSMMMDYYGI